TATRIASAPDVRPQGRVQTVSYSVRNGDSLYSISRRFSVAVADIRRWNRVEGDLLRPGQRLTLYVDPTRGI
ncbi:MAG: LysM peptidoglycan-binding domain-containing protein, partial [Chromatiales bacterium]|nr:LysM peptidoglycan-binding domain-containing protein [Chromatiales bacterium]